jgi:hypothetical protein
LEKSNYPFFFALGACPKAFFLWSAQDPRKGLSILRWYFKDGGVCKLVRNAPDLVLVAHQTSSKFIVILIQSMMP